MQEFFLDYCLTQELSHKKSRYTYLAYARQDAQRKLVIKIFDPDCINPEQEQGMFLADILLSLRHPHIIPIVDIAIKQGRPYVVREYRPHGSLRQRLSSERMDWPEAVRIVIQLGQALCYAHEHGIVHGNLKPENVFYHAGGEVQLTDFSLTSFIDMAKLEYKSDLSTIRYMAPEQFMGKTDQQSDQYSLACLAYELMTGKLPFVATGFSSLWGKHANEHAAPLASCVPKIPLPIDLAVLKAMAKKPQERYEDVAAFVAALEECLSIQVVDDALPRLNSSVATNADAFPLDNPRVNAFFAERPISSAGNPRSLSGTRPLSPLAGNIRPLSRPADELGPSSSENLLAASSFPSAPGNAEEANLFESLSTPKPSIPGSIEHGDEALRLYAQTTNALHLQASDTYADHEDLPALDEAGQRAVDIQEQSERARVRQAAASQMTEVVTVLPAKLPQSRTRKKASLWWISLVSIVVILLGTLGLSVFGASFLPLHSSSINGQQIMHGGSTPTVVAAATAAVPGTPTVRSHIQKQATASANATVQPSSHPVIMPAATSVLANTPSPAPAIAPTPTATSNVAATNLLEDGSFENATLSPWSLNVLGSGAGTVALDSTTSEDGNASAKVTITGSDSNNVWYVQLEQKNVPFIKGDTYTITFWAKASQNRIGQLCIQQSAPPWTPYFTQDFSLTTVWTEYTYIFTPTISVADTEFNFNFAQSTGSVWLDTISVV